MSKNVFMVSHSKIKLWLRCRRAYWYRYVEKLRKRFKSRPLQFGSIVHRMVEADANGGKAFRILGSIVKEQGKMFRSQREELGMIVEDVEDIMTDYFDYWDERPDLVYTPLKGKSSEHSFEVEIAPGVIAEGKIDNVGKYRGNRALVEHKTGGRFPNEDHRWRDMQGAIYVRILKMLKLPTVDGILWDYIRSKPPAVPKMLKNKKMSQRALDTLPSRVHRFLKVNGLRERDFPSLIKGAERNRGEYFKRIFQPIRPHVVDSLFNDFVDTAIEVKRLHGDDHAKQRSIGRHCEWCDYEGICRAELLGLDADFIRKKDYEQSKPHTRDEPDFEA